MILPRQLFLILVLALAWVPVLQTAHALTHVGEITARYVPPELGTVEGDTVKGVTPPFADEADGDTDNDRLCLDCLALTGLSVIFSILAIGFLSQTRRNVRGRIENHSLFSSIFILPTPPGVLRRKHKALRRYSRNGDSGRDREVFTIDRTDIR